MKQTLNYVVFRKQKGGITIFLTLILSSLSGFIIALTGLTKRYTAKCEAVYAVDNAVRSCFAEYNRELFERYHILLIDSSYKGHEKGKEKIKDHFTVYLENGICNNELCYVRISDEKRASGMNYEYLYESGVRYAREVTGIDERVSGKDDDAYFLSYILNVCKEEGDIEYLLYGSDSDEENIRLAFEEYENCVENAEIAYDLYLCDRLDAEEMPLLRERFAKRVTKHMYVNGSPGFDLGECYYNATFTAMLKSRSTGEYSVEREYAYNTKI